MLNEVKHLAIAREILLGVYPRAKRRTQNDIVHHLTCDKAVAAERALLQRGFRWRRIH